MENKKENDKIQEQYNEKRLENNKKIKIIIKSKSKNDENGRYEEIIKYENEIRKEIEDTP